MAALPGKKYFHRVLGLFLAAAFLPVFLLSFSLTGIASSALLRAGKERGREAAATFASGFRGLSEGVDRSLSFIGSAPETTAILASRDKNSGAAAGRLLALEASRGGGVAFALVGAEGNPSLSTPGPAGGLGPARLRFLGHLPQGASLHSHGLRGAAPHDRKRRCGPHRRRPRS